MITYIGKVGELSLKGSNIHEFESLLVRNTRDYLRGTDARVHLSGGRLYVECEEMDRPRVEFALSHLIGITGFSRTLTSKKNIEEIKTLSFGLAKIVVAEHKNVKTFKVKARREDKSFPLKSNEIEREVGGLIFDEKVMAVDVHVPDVIINIEVRAECLIYADLKINTEKKTNLDDRSFFVQKGNRGLPVGSSGKALVLLSGGLDSPVASYRMARRGMRVDLVYFHSYPYTSNEAKEKVMALAETLSAYSLETFLNIIPFTDVQMKIKKGTPQDWTTMMLRVCMVKASNLLAERTHASCLVTGESLGQVASQTVENLKVTEHFAALPVFRPLVGMDKEEIIRDAIFIGTYETSILPYEDCCVIFAPRHPVLRGDAETAEAIYHTLETEHSIGKSILEAFNSREVKRYFAGKCIEESKTKIS